MDSGPEADLPELFLRTAKRIRRNQMARLAPLGLTPANARALRVVGYAEHPPSMTELAERLGIVPRSATTVVDALESAGLVTRTPDPANRRAIRLALTDAGAGALEHMARARHEAAAEIFAPLGSARRELLRELLADLAASDAGNTAPEPDSSITTTDFATANGDSVTAPRPRPAT
ncbi:MarR family winged helix-turn-helix transcriptional regulator [Nocardia bovistercoris]|uniref:MarR family transcriptional regulator n=1 Tax=Nocardia bovistercoris TaxID=2785916 RepID=A0A931I4K7_9NOCA|nr:MarR family transcriptional regulator [Nocardia bovistercoris]MBH0774762.1 MarR family transcriptional regulator [Nocardia bovistercoris]